MSFFRTGDPLDDFNRLDRQQAAYQAKLPRCEKCKTPINDDIYFDVEDEILCEKCMRDRYSRSTEDWMNDNY